MRTPSLVTKLSCLSLHGHVPNPLRQARLSPHEFQLRSRRHTLRNVANAAQRVSEEHGTSPNTSQLGVSDVRIPDFKGNYRSISTTWDNLRWHSYAGSKTEAQKAVQNLFFRFNEPLSVEIYSCLIAAEADPRYGSAAEVERLLQEMESEGLARGFEVYDAALKALAVHPDNILREALLGEMKKKWLKLNSDRWHYVVSGLLRERQIELALERLGQMREASFQPEAWLLHLFICTSLSTSAFAEAFSLLQYRMSYADPMPSSIWAEALSKASYNFSQPLVDYVWRQAVETNYLNPSSGTCAALLGTAARYGNFRLADAILGLLEKREAGVEPWHLEAIFESYIQANDMMNALKTLHTMVSKGGAITSAVLQPLYTYMRSDPTRVDYVLSCIVEVFQNERDNEWNIWPLINVCVEAYMSHSNLLGALKTYRSWRSHLKASTSRPTIETYRALLYRLPNVAGKDATQVAKYILEEMTEAGLEADAAINNTLIYSILANEHDVENLDLAISLSEEMERRGQELDNNTAARLEDSFRKHAQVEVDDFE